MQPDSKQLDELLGGLGNVATAAATSFASKLKNTAKGAADKVKQGAASAKNTYQQGEIYSLTKQYRTLRNRLEAYLAQHREIFECDEQTGELLTELLGGLTALTKSAGSAAAAPFKAVARRGGQLVDATKNNYVRGEAKAMLAKIGKILKKLKQYGIRIKQPEYARLIRLQRIIQGTARLNLPKKQDDQ